MSPPTLRVVRADEQKVVPWRNGGGSTREVAIEPPTATVAGGFRWRVSRAVVASDGPFSCFRGYRRRLWLVAGAGMRLVVDGSTIVLDRLLQPFEFSGDSSVEARRIAGPVEDLNVIWDPAAVEAHTRIVTVAPGATTVPAVPYGQQMLLVLDGSAEVPAATAVLAAGDAVRGEGCGSFGLRTDRATTVLVASFAPR